MRLRLRLRLRLCLITLASVLQAASPGFRPLKELRASSRFAISSVVSHGQLLLSARHPRPLTALATRNSNRLLCGKITGGYAPAVA